MLFELLMISVVCVLLWIVGRLLMMFDLVHVPHRRNHVWRHVKYANQTLYCSICEIMLTSSGFFCECCGVCSDTLCIQTADKALKCKSKCLERHTEAQLNGHLKHVHLWVKGNLPMNCVCFVCDSDIDYHGKPGLYGYRCCWCQRAAHTNCFPRMADDKICDFGPFREFMIPPNCIVPRNYRNPYQIKSITLPSDIDWKPLIVVANPKSGDSTAIDVLAAFRSILNPIQIFELSPGGPSEALNLISKLQSVQCRILVAGGDGTAGWILAEVSKRNFTHVPEVCIIPTGTGNDLSRVLNWGSEPPAYLNTFEICERIQSATAVNLDRWLVDIEMSLSRRLPMKWLPHRKMFMYNYISVGVDAQVTFDFHKARESAFYVLSSRLLNKLLYMCYGTQQVVLPDCVGLEKKLDLYLDDVKIDLPELQSVVCINIDSWGAGVQLWQMSADDNEERYQSFSDGVIEVLGIVSSFHMAQLQIGLNKPIRLGQCRKLRIVLKESLPVQADGEPWIQHPCQINVSLDGKAVVLKASE